MEARIFKRDLRGGVVRHTQHHVGVARGACEKCVHIFNANAGGIEGVELVHGRAEEPGERREQYDFAVSRAVARLSMLCEFCLPYVKLGGAFLALKGPALSEELEEAKKAISVLGGKVERVFEYSVPGTELRHNIVVIRKVSPTPKKYPRRFAMMKKSPL